jgi:hypothetical protein
MKNNIIRFAILLVTLILTQTALADVKIKSRREMSGQSSEDTTYIKGKRMRTEQNNGGMQTVNITQCDLKRSLRVMPQAQTYMIDSWQTAQSVTPTTTTEKTQSVTKGGIITSVVTTKDTGERKQMFGYTAKHLITTMETSSSPDACSVNKSKMEIDGWSIDAAFVLNCENDQYVKNYQNQAKSGCQDRYETKQIGKARTGYPVLEKMTMFGDDGKESFTMTSEVLEISSATLDAGLFDVPNGFREVKDSTELYASMSSQSSTNKNSRNNYGLNEVPVSNDSGVTSNIKNSSQPASNLSTEVGEKKAGVVRVGLADVKTGSVGEGLSAAELAGAIENTLAEYLRSPNVELVALEAKLPSAIDAEAKSKECDYVIYANVSHKKGGGGFGMFKKLAPVLSSVTPLGGMGGSAAGAVAGSVASTAIYTAAGISDDVKSKDEITLDLKVNSTGGAAALAKQFKQKAKGDGDDIITPIIEQAAQAILDAVATKK